MIGDKIRFLKWECAVYLFQVRWLIKNGVAFYDSICSFSGNNLGYSGSLRYSDILVRSSTCSIALS